MLRVRHQFFGQQDNREWTPLHVAAEKGFLDIIHILLNTTEDRQLLNDQTTDGVTPLDIAVGNN